MFPSTARLEGLVLALLGAGGLTANQEMAEARGLWEAAELEAPRAHAPFDEAWFAEGLASHAGRAAAPPAHGGPSQTSRPLSISPIPQGAAETVGSGRSPRQDWGDAPTVINFVGRSAELASARGWLLQDRCRVVGVLGMGGIGKTSVAARLAQEVAPAFESVYWRGLRNAPPVGEWMAGAIGFLSGQQRVPPDGESNQVTALLQLLRERSSLLVLDNFETLLEPGQRDGRYRESLAGYGAVLQALAEASHRSCMLFTSREAPPEWTLLGGSATRTLELSGLAPPDGQALLANKQLSGDKDEWTDLVERYDGNSLALKIVGESIRSVFGGDIGAFLAETASGAVFGGIKRLLDEQYERSSPVEQEVLGALAIAREGVTIAELLADLGPRTGRGALVEAIEALQHRSLLEQLETAGGPAFTLQSVVLEYVTERLVERVSHEIMHGQPVQLVEHPVIQAHARVYIRLSQERLIGQSVLAHLRAQLGAQDVERLLIALLDKWRGAPRIDQGFGPGNVVNLLRLHRGDLRGLDLSRLTMRQAYLAGVDAQDVSFADADLSQAVLTETFNYPLSVALSVDGASLVAGTSAGEVCLWRVADHTPLLVLQAHSGPVHRVGLSADGQMIASSSEDGTIRLFDATSGRRLGMLSGHTSPVYAMVLSGDGRVMASGSFDGSIRLWDVASQHLVATLKADTSPVWSVSLTRDAELLASGSFDGSIRLWSVRTKELLSVLGSGDEGSPVWSLRLSEDGAILASGHEDARIRLWSPGSGQLLATLEGHTGSVRGVAFSADGRLLATGSWDGTVRVWNPADGLPLAILEGHTGPVRSVAFGANGQLLASCSLDGSVRLWESPSGRPLAIHEGHTSPVYGVALSADGGLLATGGWDGTVNLWDPTSGQKLDTLIGHTSPVYGVALSGDGQIVASGSWDRSMRVWRTTNTESVSILQGHAGGVRSVSLNGDGTLLASASWDGTVRLWRGADGRPIRTLRGHVGGVRSVAVTTDGGIVASGGLDGTVRLWRTADGLALGVFEGTGSPVYCVALSAGGRLLACGSWDGSLRVWEVETGRLLTFLEGHTGEVRGVALGRDDSLLASCGFDAKVRLWTIPGGSAVATLEGHTSPVYGVAMGADGALLATGSFDGTVRLWDVDSGVCLRVLRSDRPYERADVGGLTGITEAQHLALLTLGAVEPAR
jgi:WD40 repeat protein